METMNLFVIFFWMVIGCACLDLQRIEDGENYLKSNKSGRKAASLVANETVNEDKHNRSKDVTPLKKSADKSSNKTKSSEEPPSVVAPMTVTSEVKKSGKGVLLGRRKVDLQSLLKHFPHPHISLKIYSMEVKKGFPGTSTAIRETHRPTDISFKTRRSIRTKRNLQQGRYKGQRGWRNMQVWVITTKPGFMKQYDRSVEKEKELIRSLATSGTVSTDFLNQYKEEKTKERKLVHDIYKNMPSDDPQMAEATAQGYLRLLDDTVEGEFYKYDTFNITKSFPEFFNKPSPALTKYKAMKQKEYDTIESYLEGPGSGDIYEGQTGNEFEEGAINNSANADFECPKKKRESGSGGSKMHAQVLMTFSCMVIGIIIVGLQGLEFGEDDLQATKNAGKVHRGRRQDRIWSTEARIDRIYLDWN